MGPYPKLKEGESSPFARPRNLTLIERLMQRTSAMSSGCWQWQGAHNPKGYGHIRGPMNAPLQSVHRVSYEYFKGPIPDGLEIDHLCFNRACVNPDHLETVTRRENVCRGQKNQNHNKTHCIYGHEFTSDNTAVNRLGKRVCRACSRRTTAEHRSRKASQQ